MHLDHLIVFVVSLFTTVLCAMELPKFSQLKLLYPGYYLHGGRYRDKDIFVMVGGHIATHMHNTASLRMSLTLNKCGGRHGLGTEPIFLSKKGRDSYTGGDSQEYIFRNTAYGPFLAERYGNPMVAKPNKHDHTRTMDPFVGKQGIARLVSYHAGRKHAGGHIALWDCDHFFQSRDWTTELHIISVEFWETPDSYCPPPSYTPVPVPILQPIDGDQRKVLSEGNLQGQRETEYYDKPERAPKHHSHHHLRHHRPQKDRPTHGQQ